MSIICPFEAQVIRQVRYLCSCGLAQPLSKLYFCRHCLDLRCGFCVSHEVDSHYCPNCLENMPSAEARLKKNRCANCFDCPSCGHTLSTRATSMQIQAPTEDGTNVKIVTKKLYYLVCAFCRWAIFNSPILSLTLLFDLDGLPEMPGFKIKLWPVAVGLSQNLRKRPGSPLCRNITELWLNGKNWRKKRDDFAVENSATCSWLTSMGWALQWRAKEPVCPLWCTNKIKDKDKWPWLQPQPRKSKTLKLCPVKLHLSHWIWHKSPIWIKDWLNWTFSLLFRKSSFPSTNIWWSKDRKDVANVSTIWVNPNTIRPASSLKFSWRLITIFRRWSFTSWTRLI